MLDSILQIPILNFLKSIGLMSLFFNFHSLKTTVLSFPTKIVTLTLYLSLCLSFYQANLVAQIQGCQNLTLTHMCQIQTASILNMKLNMQKFWRLKMDPTWLKACLN